MVIAWWKDSSVILLDKKYQQTEIRTKHVQEQVGLIGLFFGSFRNRPTKHFIKYLNKFHAYLKQHQSDFEIIYVPLDEDEEDCEFFVTSVMGDWLSVPWNNQQLRRSARNMYNVLDQPSLVIVKNDEKGSQVSFDGKNDLIDYGYYCLREWEKIASKIVIVKEEKAPAPAPSAP